MQSEPSFSHTLSLLHTSQKTYMKVSFCECLYAFSNQTVDIFRANDRYDGA